MSIGRRGVRLWLRQAVIAALLRACEPLLYGAAFLWRRALAGTTVIAVTGSVGKTTAKDCLAHVLGAGGRVRKSEGNQGRGLGLLVSVLRIRPWHRFAVLETGLGRAGTLQAAARLTRPDIAVVLGAAPLHTSSFPTLDQVAAEKMRLVRQLRPGCLAVLNGDDPRLVLPADPAFGIRRFGTSEGCDVRGSGIEAAWPQRLRLVVHAGGEREQVSTRLVGRQWVPAILAAVAVSRECGVPLAVAAGRLAQIAPYPGRMQPVRVPSGAVILRDECNASHHTLLSALRVLGEARAGRKVLVAGNCTDLPANSKQRFRMIGKLAAGVADAAVFVGEHAHLGGRAAVAAGLPSGSVRAFSRLEAAADFLRCDLGPGDLVLLKGRTSLHFSRIVFALAGQVRCRRERCAKMHLCDFCWELGTPAAQMRLIEPL